VQVVGFGKKSVGAFADRFFRPAAGTDDPPDLRKARTSELRQRDAVHRARHADVCKQHMHGQGTFQNRQCLFRIGGFQHLHAMTAQLLGQHQPNQNLVLDQENRQPLG